MVAAGKHDLNLARSVDDLEGRGRRRIALLHNGVGLGHFRLDVRDLALALAQRLRRASVQRIRVVLSGANVARQIRNPRAQRVHCVGDVEACLLGLVEPIDNDISAKRMSVLLCAHDGGISPVHNFR